MRGRWIILLGIFLIGSGCVQNQLSGGLVDTCLSASETHVLRTPECTTMETCTRTLDERIPFQGYENTGIGTEIRSVERGMAGGWKAINDAAKTFGQIHENCTSGNPVEIVTKGMIGASQIKEALRQNEKASEWILIALSKGAEKGKALELERVKDTRAFHAYGKILEIIQDITTQNSSATQTEGWNNAQVYFQEIGKTITDHELPRYRVNPVSAFDIYATILKQKAPANIQPILMLAPAWQSAITSFGNNQRIDQGIQLVQEIRAHEMIEHIEDNLSPPDGTIVQMIYRLEELEQGVRELEENETKTLDDFHARLKNLDEKMPRIIEKEEIWEKNDPIFHKWNEKISISWETESEIQIKEGELQGLSSRLETLEDEKARNQTPLGQRVQDQREFSKKLGDVAQNMIKKEEEGSRREEACYALAQWILNHDPSLERKHAAEAYSKGNKDTEDCQILLQELGPPAQDDKKKTEGEDQIGTCVQRINEYRKALDLDEERDVEYYIQEFGTESGITSCRAEESNLRIEYENQETVREINRIRGKINEESVALLHVENAYPELIKNEERSMIDHARDLAYEDEIHSIDEQQKIIQKFDEAETELEDEIQKIIQRQADHMIWRLNSPERLEAGKNEHAEWKTNWQNPFGMEIREETTFVIPTIEQFSSLHVPEGFVLEQGNQKSILSGPTLPAEGIQIDATSEESTINVAEEVTVTQIRETHALLESRMVFETKIFPLPIRWKWILPIGENPETVYVWKGNDSALVENHGNEWSGQMTLSHEQEMMMIHHENDHAVQVTRTLTQSSESKLEYEVNATSLLTQPIETTISSGIPDDPIQIQSIHVWDEDGKETPVEENETQGILISRAKIGAHETRTWKIEIELNENAESLENILQNILNQTREWEQNQNPSIEIRAAKLENELLDLLETHSTTKWAEELPEMQGKLEQLVEDAQKLDFEWDTLLDEWDILRTWKTEFPSEATTPKMQDLFAKAEIAFRTHNLKGAQKILAEIQLLKGHEIMNPIQMDETKDENAAVDVEGTLHRAQIVSEYVKKYQDEQALPCSKMILVGYVCPISEEIQKEYVKKMKEITSELEKLSKKWEVWDENQKKQNNASVQTQIKEMEKGLAPIENDIQEARALLEESAKTLLQDLDESHIEKTSNESEQAVQKAHVAFEAREFGKSIYIAKSMIAYSQEKNPLTGLSALPTPVFVLGGIAFLAGGIWIYREWNERRKIKPVFRRVPRAEELTETPHPPMDGGDDIPQTRGETLEYWPDSKEQEILAQPLKEHFPDSSEPPNQRPTQKKPKQKGEQSPTKWEEPLG